MALISAGIITAGAMLRKSVLANSKASQVVALSTFWLAMSYLLLAFSFISNKSSDTSYYVISPQPVVFMVTAFFFPALTVLVAKLATLAKIKMLYPALTFSAVISLAGIVANPYVTYTLPLFLAGSLIPAIIYDINKTMKLTSIIFGASWILTYTPYSYKLMAYSVTKQVFGLTSTDYLIPAPAPYYPLIICCGVISSLVTYRFLTEEKVMRLTKLSNFNMVAQAL